MPKIEEKVPSSVHNRYFSEVKISRLSSVESEHDSPFPLCFKDLPSILTFLRIIACRALDKCVARFLTGCFGMYSLSPR